MKTEITLDKQAIAELLKNPEVKIRLHDAVIEGITKKVVDDVSEEIKKKVLNHVDDMVMTVLGSECGQMFYPTPGDKSRVTVACKAKEVIKKAVNDAFRSQVREEVYKRLNNLEDNMRKDIDETWSLLMNKKRVEDVIIVHIKELIENGLKTALNVEE